jgi:hypothetical protein
MREAVTGGYRDGDGHRHEVSVRHIAASGWTVVDRDVAAGTGHVVEALTDGQDGCPQAEAIARDYLTTVGGAQAGAGPAAPKAIPEPGGSDDPSHRHPSAARPKRARRAALPGAAR